MAKYPRYPEIEVQLSGDDGNAFAIIARVSRALRKAGASDDLVTKFKEDAKSGDYEHLLETVSKWVTVL